MPKRSHSSVKLSLPSSMPATNLTRSFIGDVSCQPPRARVVVASFHRTHVGRELGDDMTRPYSLAFKQKMIQRLTGKNAVSAVQLARETGFRQNLVAMA
jgi:hypothetical protein